MPTYLYENVETGERNEVTQRITEEPFTHRTADGEWLKGPAKSCHMGIRCAPVKRLIAGAPRFTLVSGDSGGWAAQGYSKTEPQRQAEQQLGRKLHKPV